MIRNMMNISSITKNQILKACFGIVSFLFVFACSFNSSEILKNQAKYSDFFLCFPENDSGFSELTLNEQLIIRNKISEEKKNRNFNCNEFKNFIGVEESLDKLNKEIFRDKSAPCTRANIEECKTR